MDRKVGLLDNRVDEERREKVQRWLGEKLFPLRWLKPLKSMKKE